MTKYEVKDIKLAKQGLMNIELAEMEMYALLEVQKVFRKTRPFRNKTIGLALHITKETAVLVKTLKAGGANVAITGCNPLSTQDDIAAALVKEGINVFGQRGQTTKEYYENLNSVLDFKPDVTIDDGCDLVTLVHTDRRELLDSITGGTEETTTGIIRLHAMEKDGVLKYPVIAVNDNKTKHLMDNYYGTGQSTLDGIIRATNILIAGKTVVVAGYGSCGKGTAMRAKGLGAKIIVTEVDAFPALQAMMDGFRVMEMSDAVKEGDIYVTLTGNKHVIRMEHMDKMKEGAIVCNSGHFDVEIDTKELRKNAKTVRTVRPNLEEYVLKNGRKIFLIAEGRLVNLAAAEGHPSAIMSLSFCGQALAAEYVLKNDLDAKVHYLPESIDDYISKLQLSAMDVKIDKLTPEQIKYLASWKEGT